MAASGAFDIYQSDAGYAAVTNPIQRQILDLLREGERQLPELVELTGRSKPTLSSLHMKELLARELIEERQHATDSRRKVYRLKAQKIGSSDIPVGKLRDAIQHYVSLSPLAARIPVASAMEALAAAPHNTPDDVLAAQAHKLGASCSALFKVASVRELWMRLAAFLESERIGAPLRVDFAKGSLDLRLGAALPLSHERAAVLLAAFVNGVASGAGVGPLRVRGTALADGIRLAA